MTLNRRMVHLIVLVVALTMAVPAAAVSYGQDGPPADVPQVYREAWLAGCNPISTLMTGCAHRLDIYVNEPLVALTWQGLLKPMLAESYDMLEDGRVWVFHLREGVNWHDGEAFTADDVVWSFNAYADPAIGSRRHNWVDQVLGYAEFRNGEADSLAGVRKVDDYTVEVELVDPAPLWVNLRGIYLVMLPEHVLGAIPKEDVLESDFWQNRVGTGPFIWNEFVPDQYIELVRNEEHYLGAPILEQIILPMYADASAQIAALETGNVDTTAYETTIISMDDVARLDALDHVDVVVMDKGSPLFLRVNHTDPIFADKRVRQALRYAIPVDLMMETIYNGGRAAYTMFSQDWAIASDLNTYEYNPELARQLLEEAGFDFGKEYDMTFHFQDSLTMNLATAIQAFLAEIGVQVNAAPVDAATQNELLVNQTVEVSLAGYGVGVDPSIGDANTLCGNVLSVGYCNPELDELYAQGASLATREERAPIYQEISKILNEELPSIWLWYDLRPLGFNRRVVGPYEHYSEQGTIYFNLPVYNEVETWYVTSE